MARVANDPAGLAKLVVTQLEEETSLQYEASVGYRQPRWRRDFTFFVNNIHGNIQKQTLILPAGAAGCLRNQSAPRVARLSIWFVLPTILIRTICDDPNP